ncbi:MAG: NADP-dependent oxidoreductase [Lactobacillaceae bacterium]|jgi:NADPH:quinone reductase-like Zn-dependent oxidoreductase|nr:NADP-dependent oxidoreductase [Lactobacillaceae bacterium]
MQAIQIKQFGDVDVFEMAEVATPELSPKQVLIKNHATAIDPYDVKFVMGKMGENDKWPLIPGSSVAGEIIAVGSDVTDFKIGDRVAATRHLLTYAEEVPVGQSAVAKIPAEVNDVTAASAVLGAATGYQVIVNDLDVQAGQKILIQGGAGQVGAMAIQVALNLGATVYATVNPRDFDYLKSLGNVTPIDYHSAYENELKDFDGVLDTVGGKVAIQSAKILKDGGKLRSLATMPEQVQGYPIDAEHTYLQGKRLILAALLDDLAQGRVKIRIGQVLPFNLENVKTAHNEAREHSLAGKTVLQFEV